MGLNYRDDLFMLQVRLFRLAQIKWNKSAVECEKIFDDFEINEYIEACYEEFYVQGDEADLADIESYLHQKGYEI